MKLQARKFKLKPKQNVLVYGGVMTYLPPSLSRNAFIKLDVLSLHWASSEHFMED